MPKHPMTREGESLLLKELKKLKSEDRIKIVQAIADARELGDLKENAEYHSAKEMQVLIESRIREIESKLTDSQVIEIIKLNNTGKVIFGSTIQVQDESENKIISYKIVGEDEANVKKGKISLYSPLARAAIGKNEGDSFEVETPGGKRAFKIISVEYI